MKKTNYEKYRVFSGSMLKMIAGVTMLIDHIALHLLSEYPPANAPLLTFGGAAVTWYAICRKIGRTAFPLYCFLIAEGCRHTHDRLQYGIRLAAFALISEIPWNLVHTGTLRYERQNVFFTLFLGYCCIAAYTHFEKQRGKLLLSLLALLCVSLLLRADYGIRGMALILMLYVLREERVLGGMIGCCMLNEGFATVPAFLLTGLYSGERGFIRSRYLQYFFYVFYPAHLLVLWILRCKLSAY